ncbi:hypothetical protein LCGC14_0856850 [marine sediment metagenome]|uniref:Uncharacterized protein n=1 Tax=marine sediment metagenome TaxID=412755 RepID=A0A0F9PDE7_9ZZZZ
MTNVVDAVDALKHVIETHSKFYARAIDLLQTVIDEIDGNDEVSKDTIAEIEAFLDENYNEALQEMII